MTKNQRNPKLHELLAVEMGLKTQAAATTADLMSTFSKKKDVLFTGRNMTFVPFVEDLTSGNVERTG